MGENAYFKPRVPPTSKIEYLEPNLGLLSLPFLFNSRESVFKALEEDFGKYIVKGLSNESLYYLGMWESGFKNFTSSTPLTNLSSFSHKIFRVMSSPMLEKQTINLGSFPEYVDFSELRSAIDKGQIDIQENPINSIYAMGFYEGHKYLTISRHGFLGQAFLVSTKIFESLDSKTRDIIVDAAHKATKFQREKVAELEERNLKEIEKHGTNIVRPSKTFLADLINSQASIYYSYREHLKKFKKHINPEVLKFLDDSYIIGVNLAYSSAAADSAIAIKRGVDLALKDANKRGGIKGKPIRALYLNHEGFPRKGIENLKILNKIKGLVGVIGGMHSPVVLAEREFVNANRLPYVIAWAAATPIIAEENKSIFRTSIRDEYAASKLIERAKTKSKNIILLLENTGWGNSNLNAINNIVSADNSINIEKIIRFNWGEQNFIELNEILKESNKKYAVIFVGNSPEGIHLVSSLQSLKQKPYIASHWGITGGNFWQKTRKILPKLDFEFLTTFAQDSKSTRIRNFFEKYKNEFKLKSKDTIPALFGTIHGYEAANILISGANISQDLKYENIVDSIYNLKEYNGITGNYNYPFKDGKIKRELFDDSVIKFGKYDRQGNIITSE